MDARSQEPVPWRARDIVFILFAGLAIGLGLVIVGFLVLDLSGANTGGAVGLAVGSTMVNVGIGFGVYLFILRRYHLSLRDLWFRRPPFGTMVLMVPVYIAMSLVVGTTVVISRPLLGDPPSASEQLVVPKDGNLAPTALVLLVLAAAVIAPVIEELFFRGLIYRYLRGRWGVVVAVVVSSLLFAAAHVYVPLMPALFIMGVTLALVVERYRSLYPAILLHAITNAVAIAVVASA